MDEKLYEYEKSLGKEEAHYPDWFGRMTDSVLCMVALGVLALVFSPILVVFGAFSPLMKR
ncbi:hypothetical protein [uncultured Sphaerochaeta sp.]|uniref:hypothetical protein n=1 Tax=uncultured Sphaerochaeta sp. TaxID=886478 RepID=UPI002A0A9123|nr:hypothetical protein [uncultured Sphaerochaeta sp.]